MQRTVAVLVHPERDEAIDKAAQHPQKGRTGVASTPRSRTRLGKGAPTYRREGRHGALDTVMCSGWGERWHGHTTDADTRSQAVHHTAQTPPPRGPG